MTRINTYVFIDLETSGLPSEELNKTRITELSLVAVKRAHLALAAGAPRVQQRLTLCFDPRRRVRAGAAAATGLCNELLEAEPAFSAATFSILDSFIGVLTKPVCLVAHNGNGFDYPILKKHLVDLDVSFDDDLFCVDSFHAFYHILEKKKEPLQQNVAQNSVGSSLDQQSHEQTPDQIKLVEETKTSVTLCSESLQEVEPLSAADFSSMKQVNETTPKQIKQTVERGSPMTVGTEQKYSVKEVRKARRRFPWSVGEKPTNSYKLGDVYQRLLNRTPVNAHRAEVDCILALECAVCVANEFINWVDDNCIKFTEIKPMTIGVPLGE